MTNKELFQSYIKDIKDNEVVMKADESRKLKLIESWKNKMYLDFGFLEDMGFKMRFMTTHGHRYDAYIISIYRENEGWNFQYDGYVLVHDIDDMDIDVLKGMYLTDWISLSSDPDYINAEFDTLRKLKERIKTISKEKLIRRFAAWYSKEE